MIIVLSVLLLLLQFIGIIIFSESFSTFWGPEWINRSEYGAQWQRSSTEFISNTKFLVYGNYQRNLLLPFDFTPLGISYEPHVNMFFVTPAILLIDKNRSLWLVVILLYSILVYSLTAILSLLVCLGVFLIWRKHWKMLAVLSFLVLSLLPVILEIGLLVKLIDGGRSRETSASYLAHILSPKLFSNYSVLDIPQVFGTSISYYGFLVYVFVYGTLINLFLKLTKRHALTALSLLYILLHSLKFPLHIVNYPLVYIIVIFLYDEYRSKKVGI